MTISSTGIAATNSTQFVSASLIFRTQKIKNITKNSKNLSFKKKKIIQRKLSKSVSVFSKVSQEKRTIRFSKFIMAMMKNDIHDERTRSEVMYQVSSWMLQEFDYRVYKSDWDILIHTQKGLKNASKEQYSNYLRRKQNLYSQKVINGLLDDLDHYTSKRVAKK